MTATERRQPAGRGAGRTWIESDGTGARLIGRPVRRFLHVETAGSLVLLAATIASLILANTAWSDSITSFWSTDLVLIEIGDFHLEESLAEWVNDGLMAIFFFVVGLEIKRELVDGELTDRQQAALPAIAAIGGMIVPAGFYFLLNTSGPGSAGWGIPMATDIAFAVGLLGLLGNRVPTSLKVFLLTLAVVDDIGAIVVIALFYTSALDLTWLAVAVALLGLIVFLRVRKVWYTPIYVVIGAGVWIATLESGVHATIAGVVLGLLTPAKPLRPNPTALDIEPTTSWQAIQATLFDAKETVPVAQRLQQSIHPWTAFVVLPLFAFANAGISITTDSIADAAASPVTLGIIVGLVLGKPIGIVIAAWLAVRTGGTTLPDDVSWRHVVGASTLAGIGFTVSLFITGLAFTDPVTIEHAKVGVLVASALAAVAGIALLMKRTPGVGVHPSHPSGAEPVADRPLPATVGSR